MRELLIATKNIGKYREIVEALDGLDLGVRSAHARSATPEAGKAAPARLWRVASYGSAMFKFVFLKDFLEGAGVDDSDFVEDGETFAENARKKAEYYFGKSGMLTLGEDSGILVEALSGELGVKTRRWGAGENASDEQWIEFFLERMRGENNRLAEFVCCACLYGPAKLTHVSQGENKGLISQLGSRPILVNKIFEGKTPGLITRELQAPLFPGIPLSSCFLPEGADKVYSALSVEEKNRISHRGKTMVGVREWLEGNLF